MTGRASNEWNSEFHIHLSASLIFFLDHIPDPQLSGEFTQYPDQFTGDFIVRVEDTSHITHSCKLDT